MFTMLLREASAYKICNLLISDVLITCIVRFFFINITVYFK